MFEQFRSLLDNNTSNGPFITLDKVVVQSRLARLLSQRGIKREKLRVINNPVEFKGVKYFPSRKIKIKNSIFLLLVDLVKKRL